MEQQIKVIREAISYAKRGDAVEENTIAEWSEALAQLEQSIQTLEARRDLAEVHLKEATELGLEQPVNSGSEELIERLKDVKNSLVDDYSFTEQWIVKVVEEAIVRLSQVKPSVVWKKYPDEKPELDRWIVFVNLENLNPMVATSYIRHTKDHVFLNHCDYWCYEADLISTITKE